MVLANTLFFPMPVSLLPRRLCQQISRWWPSETTYSSVLAFTIAYPRYRFCLFDVREFKFTASAPGVDRMTPFGNHSEIAAAIFWRGLVVVASIAGACQREAAPRTENDNSGNSG